MPKRTSNDITTFVAYMVSRCAFIFMILIIVGITANPVSAGSDSKVDLLNQKRNIIEKLLGSNATRRLMESGHKDAIASILLIRDELKEADSALATGDSARSGILLDQALINFFQALRLVNKKTVTNIAVEKKSYTETLDSVFGYLASLDIAFLQSAASDSEKQSVIAIKKLISDAQQDYKLNKVREANLNLAKAETLAEKLVTVVQHNQTIVYDLKFDSPKDEYEYELKRYRVIPPLLGAFESRIV